MSNTTASTTSAAPAKTFADFGLDPLLSESLAEAGIIHPFPIQEMTLPLALTGADIIGQARTGTGKTLAFGLPLLQRLDIDGGLQALIIVPTRELCLQVAEDLAQAGRAKNVAVAAVYGGKAMQPQIDAIADGANVVVGTPGRLLDLSRRGFLNLSKCGGLVLDEADEMLDLGFLPDVEQLIEQCADQRQTLLFSATMPAAIVGLARRYMTKPTFMRADVEEVHIAPATKQFFFSCHRMDKPAVLARILSTPDRGLCVVFCRTKRMADQLSEDLRDRGLAAQAIHSDLRQEARERAMEKFRKGTTTVLCATEVAARGLDIDDVTHVVNYDCPDDEKMYLHRIGRTGRAGADGVAITFAVWSELARLEMIRRDLDIEEPVHEVFSTSPLLEELFDLPVRVEKAKVPSPPKARKGKDSRSRRRSERSDEAETSERSVRPKKSERSERSGKPERSERSSRPAAKDEDEGAADVDTITRTRRRRRAGGDEPESTDSSTSANPANGRDRSDAADPTETPGTSALGGDGDQRVRRTRSRGAKSAAGTTGSDSTTSTSTGRERDDRGGNGRNAGGKGRSGSSRPDSDRTDRGGRDQSRKGSDRNSTDRNSTDRNSTDRNSTDRDGTGRDGTGRNGSKEGDSARSAKNRSSRSRSESGSSDSRRSGGRGTGNNRSRSGGGRDRQADRGRERIRSVLNTDEARGEGTPRLSRKLEVTHLP